MQTHPRSLKSLKLGLVLLVAALVLVLGQALVGASSTVEPAADAPALDPSIATEDASQPAASFRTITTTSSIVLAPIGNISAGAVAEIPTFDPETKYAYVTNSDDNRIDVISLVTPTMPMTVTSIDLTPYGGGPNSVDFYSYGPADDEGLLAVAVEAVTSTDPGFVIFFDRTFSEVFSVTVGPLPDMLIFTPDGSKLLVANEGESVGDGSGENFVDPEGSISIISVVTGTGSVILPPQTADFTAFNAQKDSLVAAGVQIFSDTTVAEDVEPEYIAVSPDGMTALVTLQEANAVAVVDIMNATITDILPLGFKDHSLPGNMLDASDRDGAINIRNWPVFGSYEPDAIASFEVGGQTYYVTANEGDSRDDGMRIDEEARVNDLVLDPGVFGGGTALLQDDQLGRLNVSNQFGDTDGDGDFDVLYSHGARSFSIWGSDGSLVYDSGDDIEFLTAAYDPFAFNGQIDDDGVAYEFDNRSDNKGAEPEGVVVGVVDGRTYAFVGLERFSAILVYDVTEPTMPQFVQLVNTWPKYGDISPEGLEFVSAADSPTGNPLLIVTYEVSGSVTVFEITDNADGAGTLTLLHNNDGESTIQPLEASNDVMVAGVAAYKSVLDRERADARMNGNSVVNVYAGDSFLASSALQCSEPGNPNSTVPVYDAVAQRYMGYDAHIFGNHEFDYTPDFLERFIRDSAVNGMLNQPFISANLDFSNEPGFADLIDADGILMGYSTDGEVVAKSKIVIDEVTGQRFGVVGATTWLLETISSPRDVEILSTSAQETVELIQTEVDRLDAMGVKKIILVSHLQSLSFDRTEVIPNLSKVDIAVGGGGDELLVNNMITATVPLTMQLLPGESLDAVSGNYPEVVQDGDGNDVYIVTTAGNYKYAGRLDVVFDDNGQITSVIQEKSYPRRVVVSDTNSVGIMDAVMPDPTVQAEAVDPVVACLEALAAQVIAETEVTLDVRRNTVRGQESNAGNMIADAFRYAHAKYATTSGVAAPDNHTIAVQNGGGIRQNAGDFLPVGIVLSTVNTINPTNVGTITVQNANDVLPFDNDVTVIQNIPATDVKAIFERAASRIGGGQFLQVSGVTVMYDLNGTAQVISGTTVTVPGSRVMSVQLEDGTYLVQNGMVLTNAPALTITTNSFTAAGGDDYPWFRNATMKTVLGTDTDPENAISYFQAWFDFLSDAPSGTPGPQPLNGRIPASNPAYQFDANERIFITPAAPGTVDALNNAGLTSLASAIESAGLSQAVNALTQTTFFAPTNEAFAALRARGAFTPTLQDTLLYHVAPGVVNSSDVATTTLLKTLQGSLLKVMPLSNTLQIQNARVLTADVTVPGGVLHIIDGVLMPQSRGPIYLPLVVKDSPGTLAEEATKAGFTALVGALQATGLDATLADANAGPFTVFAPTNAAFNAISTTVATLSVTQTTNVLLYHVVQGEVPAATVVANSPLVANSLFAGHVFTVTATTGTNAMVTVEDEQGNIANVTMTDVQASNGIIHVIDKVILPSALE